MDAEVCCLFVNRAYKTSWPTGALSSLSGDDTDQMLAGSCLKRAERLFQPRSFDHGAKLDFEDDIRSMSGCRSSLSLNEPSCKAGIGCCDSGRAVLDNGGLQVSDMKNHAAQGTPCKACRG
jgi:hypothetical protein